MADRPWLIRTYSGHSSARASNELYRTNLAKGQTGLSVAFDLPTQTGYDPDHPLARGEVGKVGVPVPHLGEMRDAVRRHPARRDEHVDDDQRDRDVAARHVPRARRRAGRRRRVARGHDAERHREGVPVARHVHLPARGVDAGSPSTSSCTRCTNVPQWNPINVCPYHLQEAGATPVQELAYGLATAIGVLDAVRDSGQVPDDEFPEVVGRISFFIDAGVRFVEEMCKMRAFTRMWDRICLERYGVTDEKLRRFRYGMQVNSLGLTEEQPENNVQRIVLEMLGVTLSKDARRAAIQLPCWNEALGLPTPVGPAVVAAHPAGARVRDRPARVRRPVRRARRSSRPRSPSCATAAEAELQWVLDGGGAFAMIDEMKGRLVQSHAERVRRIESGDIKVVGVNCFTETEPSPLADVARRRGEHPDARPGGRARADRRARGVASATATTTRSTRALERLREVAAHRREPHARDDRARPRRRHRRRVGRARCARCSASTARPPASARSRAGPGAEMLDGPRPGAGRGRRARRPDPAPRRQARARRPLERRRADRGRRPRRRHGGRLPGHPAHAGPDRGRGPRRGRRRRRPLDPLGLAPRAGARDDRGSCGPRASTRRWSSAGSSPTVDQRRCSKRGVARVYTPKDFRLAAIMADSPTSATRPSRCSRQAGWPTAPMRNRMQ